jgi:tRNA pseudouridine55 synthase
MAVKNSFNQHGILLVHKPVGMSSARLVSLIKRVSGARKVGHSGTLDPFASGLMVVGINHGTRISRFFLSGDKSYTAEIMFGTETDTLDSTGVVVKNCSIDFFENHEDFFSVEKLVCLLKEFEGPQLQNPPVYSALKHNGVPLYKLARQGKPVQKEARPVVIHAMELKDVHPPAITVDVACSTGTYIRSLAADIGERTGCGAHLSALSRTESCGFLLNQAVSLDDLCSVETVADAMISLNDALHDMPVYQADESLKARIQNGISLSNDNDFLSAAGALPFIKIIDEDKNVIAILEYDKTKGLHNYCCVFHD